MVLDQVIKDGLDLIGFEIVVVVPQWLLFDLEERKDLFCLFSLEGLELFFAGFAPKFDDLGDLVYRILSR